MKKIIYSFIALCVAVASFTSCEDVPMPYNWPNNGGGSNENGIFLSETFNSTFGDFEEYTTKGTPWVINRNVATATGYASNTTTPSESYLVSKSIDLSEVDSAYLQFQYIYRYAGRATAVNKVYITDNYTGDAATTNWVDITGTLVEGNDWENYSTYSLNIPSEFIGKSSVRIALYYACETASATWQVKNLILAKGSVAETPVTPETPGTPEGSGTQADPYNVYGAIEQIKTLATTDTLKNVFVKGKVVSVSSVDTTRYYNATFYISDDGTTANQLYCFRVKNLENTNFTSASQVAVGDEVIITGEWINYNGSTPETAPNKAYIYSRNGNTTATGGTPTPTPTFNGTYSVVSDSIVTLTYNDVTAGTETATINLNISGLENNTEVSGPYAFNDGATVTVAKGSGNNAPKFYTATKGFRLYAKNTLTFEASKKIAKIEMVCDKIGSTIYVGNPTATVSFSETGAVYTNEHTAATGGVQLRPKRITITYAQ